MLTSMLTARPESAPRPEAWPSESGGTWDSMQLRSKVTQQQHANASDASPRYITASPATVGYAAHGAARPHSSSSVQQVYGGSLDAEEGFVDDRHVSPHRPSALEFTKKPLGTLAPTNELNPVTPSQKIRLKHRASTLIQRYAGSKWREAQRSKWLLDIVTHIDTDYREYILNQAQHIQVLQDQVLMLQSNGAVGSQALQDRCRTLGEANFALEAQLRDANSLVLELQARLAHAENALGSAEAAAHAAAAECAQLSSAVSTLADSEARARKSMATRNVLLRDGLRASETRARSLAEDKRRCELESQVLCRLHDDDMADRLHSVEAHHAAQLEVVHNVERAAAQLSVERVRMELAAYKEPWVYLHGKKAPTANADVARRLGLKMTALNTLHVPP